MKPIKTPVFLAALGLCMQEALLCFLPYFLVDFVVALVMTKMPFMKASATPFDLMVLVAWAVAMVPMCIGLAMLLHRLFRIWRIGAIAWSVSTVATGLWPLAVLLPAACRMGNRPAARRAAWGGGTLLLALGLRFLLFLGGAPVYWPMLLAFLAGMGLVLASLYSICDGSRQLRALGWTFAGIVALVIATQPVFHVGRVRRQADEAFSVLIERLDPPISRDRLLVARIPDTPVAEQDESPEKAALTDEKASFAKLKDQLYPNSRRQPLTADELAVVDAWFASHTNYMALAERLSASPDAALSGGYTSSDAAEGSGFQRISRLNEQIYAARIMVFHARAAADAGDGDAAPEAFHRIRDMIARYGPEISPVEFLMGIPWRSMSAGLVDCRIDLWDEEDLLAMQQAVDLEEEDIEGRLRIAIAGGMHEVDSGIEDSVGIIMPNGKVDELFRYGGAFGYWAASGRRFIYRNGLESWEAIHGILEKSSGNGVIGDAFERLKDDEIRRSKANPMVNSLFGFAFADMPRETVVECRNTARFVRTAIAIERYRRAHGGDLPPTLEALVPDFIEEVPRSVFTGEPLAYEPGPIDIPEEEIAVFRDPDELVAEDRKEDNSWVFGLFAADGSPEKEEAIRRINEGIKDRTANQKRTLPAMTLPGFRLEKPIANKRYNRLAMRDFFFASPASQE